MAHSHPISDDDRLFVIDPTNRSITYEGDNIVLVKGDLNSEVFSFEIPRIVEGHDMSLCDHVRIHYSNTDRRRKNESKDIYYVTDCVVNGDVVNFSWTLSGNATKYYGTLSFLVQFCCLDEDGTYSYIWNTDTYKSIPVYDSYNNSEGVEENYADVFDKIFLQLEKMPDTLSDLENDVGAVFVNDSASIGQIIKVAEVDDTGKPTAWEPADLPKQAQSDWEQNDESQADFVKNRPFYIATEPTTIVEEKSLSLTRQPNSGFKAGVVFDTYFSYSGELKKTSISSNDKLRITFDGTVYDCDAYYDDSLGYCFGNYALTTNEGREDTGEPFFICIEEENDYYVGYYLTLSFYTEQTECTVKIEELVKTVHKIDSKFIKYDIDTGAGGQSIIENDTEHNSASGYFSHAEGSGTTASGYSSHAEGSGTTANGYSSHAEGNRSTASGAYSHAEGDGTIAIGSLQHVQGRFNIEDTYDDYAHIVGNGSGFDRRSNAHTLDWDGNAWFAGEVKVGGTGQDDNAAKTLATTEDIPVVDGTLTHSGQAADAKAVGDRLSTLSEEIVTTSESKVAAHNTGTDTHSDIRLLIQGLTDRLNALADSDDTTLDQMSEVVAYIKSNKTLIEAITTSKVSVTDIVNDLVTNAADKPLSAAQGVVVKTLIDALRKDKLDAAELTNAINTALAQAKASGEFDGTDGKSAYQYAVEGGYTGTESEFVAKLAEELPTTLPNPNALTFTGAVTGTYDGSAAVSVEIPAGGGGSGDITDVLMDVTIEEAVAAVTVTLDTPRAYKELYIATCVYGDESNSSANAMILRVNNTDTMNSKNVIAWIPSVENATSATSKSYGVAFVKLLDDCSFYYCYGSKSANERTPNLAFGGMYTNFNRDTIISTLKFQSINQWTKFGVGSTIKVYGVRS